jgi:hypothetical protein
MSTENESLIQIPNDAPIKKRGGGRKKGSTKLNTDLNTDLNTHPNDELNVNKDINGDNKPKKVRGKKANNKVNKVNSNKDSEYNQANDNDDANMTNDDELNKVKSKRKLRNKLDQVKEPVRCSSRIANGEQCRRNCRGENDLCSCHLKHCPYGKVDGPLEGKFLVVPRKRGPKMKNTKEYSLEELDPTLYQQTEMIKINGQHYLIDQWSFLFKNDNNCEIVGRRIGNEIHWYC